MNSPRKSGTLKVVLPSPLPSEPLEEPEPLPEPESLPVNEKLAEFDAANHPSAAQDQEILVGELWP